MTTSYLTNSMTIHWVRHAESCANFYTGNIQDYIPDNYESNKGRNKSSNISLKKQNRSIYNLISSIRNMFVYQPNLSFIGMQQGIKLGMDFINFQPEYDIVFVSPTIRTIMTALMCLRTVKTKIYVIPFILEHQNITKIINSDYQNMQVDTDKLKRITAFIKDWLQKEWMKYYDDIEVINVLHLIREYISKYDNRNILIETINNILNSSTNVLKSLKEIYNEIKKDRNLYEYLNNKTFVEIFKFDKTDVELEYFFRSSPVDFSILEYFDKLNMNKKELGNFDNFYKLVLPYVKDNITRILCISHGSVLRTYFSKKYKFDKPKSMLNTQVIEEQINDFNNSINMKKHIPNLLRTEYENFEDYNVDVCAINSVKGFINYPLWDINLERSIIPLKSSFVSFNKMVKEYVNPDIKPYMAQEYSGKGFFRNYATTQDIKYYDKKYNDTVIE